MVKLNLLQSITVFLDLELELENTGEGRRDPTISCFVDFILFYFLNLCLYLEWMIFFCLSIYF